MKTQPKLVWLQQLCDSLELALGTSVRFTIQETVDPLKKIVFLDLGESLGKTDFNPIQRLVHGFAKENDCVIHKIYKQPKQLILEIFIKTRLGPVMNKNPLTLRDKGRPS